MLVEIAGHWVEIEGIQTGLTKNPFDCEPVVPMPKRVNWVKAEGLPVCPEHEHYTGFQPPDRRCAQCWRNHLELKRGDFVRRAARRK
jgi:hypothetical protein